MKNILVLTSVYPADDLSKENTSVVHYFAKEWVIQGYNVKVIHNLTYYPQLIHFIIRLFKNLISKHFEYPFPLKQNAKEKFYTLDHVDIYRLPIFKLFARALYTKATQEKQLNRIIKLLYSLNYVPDLVIGHWPNPQLYQVRELGKIYNSRTCIVLHNDVEIIGKIYKNNQNSIVNLVDIWGFRSNEIKNRFERLFGMPVKSFLCYSGIPANLLEPPARTFDLGVKEFLFVGLLIPRKFPSVIVESIYEVFKGNNFHITFIGRGPEKETILKLASNLKIANNISFYERMSRDDVFKKMRLSDCFIMISKPETFGLVYLEAMSMGCITIGSKKEGIDGIIQPGINGFLCNAGDGHELSELLKEIKGWSKEELITLSNNAIKTAGELTDKNVARRYIESVY